MPSYLVTMTRLDRRTAVVEAPNASAAEQVAKGEFEFAEADELNDVGAITIVNVTTIEEED